MSNEIALTIGQRMSSLRAQRGLSLQDVADRTGMSKSHVWDMEQGKGRNPSIDAAVRLASALGVSLDYLTGITSTTPDMHPDALRIACEIDALLRNRNGSTP